MLSICILHVRIKIVLIFEKQALIELLKDIGILNILNHKTILQEITHLYIKKFK